MGLAQNSMAKENWKEAAHILDTISGSAEKFDLARYLPDSVAREAK
jgi:hypothetical protein